MRLAIQLVHVATLKIAGRVYQAVHRTIQGKRSEWESQNPFLTQGQHDDNDYRVLKLEGSDVSAMNQAKTSLKGIISAQIAMHDGEELWIPLFAITGPITQEVKTLEHRFQVVIELDKRLCHLRIYGHPQPGGQHRQGDGQPALLDASSRP